METVLTVLGLAVGAALCALGLCGLMMFWDKYRRTKAFDERQMLHRGRAAALGCIVAVGYGLALSVWEGFVSWPADFIGYVGVWLIALVVIAYCILTESLIRPSKKYGWIGFFLLFSGVSNLISFYHKNQELTWYVEKGLDVMGQYRHFTNLLSGVSLILWGILILMTQWHYSRE